MPVFVQKNHVTAHIPAEKDDALAYVLKKETARNRAIILLALKLGLRDIDICTLRFSSIDWNQDCLRIPQKKTDEPLFLPLLTEVGNAIMEYILEERPQSDDGYPYVFRRKQAPYRKIGSAYRVCSNFMERNVIHPVNGASKDVHVFRYTLVNRLLRAKVPHQVITDTLGHRSKESDKPYLSMEADMLRLCALDLSLISSIPWKGGSANE
ncbi:MAG: tyrosine-type recombinase/integrase [Youngiibacter sp.]|nr:tyrosine-type recombinase/integrase [Youngiibacter sp.]